MGYLEIKNLYADARVLAFEKVYALEKIHGTSANVSWHGPEYDVTFSSGGMSHQVFREIFDVEKLRTAFLDIGLFPIIVHGEAYGGKMQAMSETYGKLARFVAFDVKVDGRWLDVPEAEKIVRRLELEFVDYVLVSSTEEALDIERDRPSVQAKRNGIEVDRPREGIVIRPVFECFDCWGNRLIAKHKGDEFKETAKGRKLDQPELITTAQHLAEEYATPMRLNHVLDKFVAENERQPRIEDTNEVIKRMIADIIKEGKHEMSADLLTTAMSKAIHRAVGSVTVRLFKAWLRAENIGKREETSTETPR